MAERLLTAKDVAAKTAMGVSTIYLRVSAGTFPRPRKLCANCVRWRESEVDAWIEALPAAQPEARA